MDLATEQKLFRAVHRPTVYGNPFVIGKDGDRAEVIRKFREYFLSNPYLMQKAKSELQGKVLACFCDPLPCHAHIIAAIIDQAELFTENTPDMQSSMF